MKVHLSIYLRYISMLSVPVLSVDGKWPLAQMVDLSSQSPSSFDSLSPLLEMTFDFTQPK